MKIGAVLKQLNFRRFHRVGRWLLKSVGWYPIIDLKTGMKTTCDWYIDKTMGFRKQGVPQPPVRGGDTSPRLFPKTEMQEVVVLSKPHVRDTTLRRQFHSMCFDRKGRGGRTGLREKSHGGETFSCSARA